MESTFASIDISSLCQDVVSAREGALNPIQDGATDPLVTEFVQQILVWNLVKGLGKVLNDTYFFASYSLGLWLSVESHTNVYYGIHVEPL